MVLEDWEIITLAGQNFQNDTTEDTVYVRSLINGFNRTPSKNEITPARFQAEIHRWKIRKMRLAK